MKNLLLTILMLGVAAAGCGRESSTSPVLQGRSWDQVVLAESHSGAGEPESEIQVRSDGALTLLIERGSVSSSRGLLAGDKLEMLTRLVDALPPSSYTGPSSCPGSGSVLTVTVGDVVRSFASDSCDSAVPEAVQEVRDFVSGLGASTISQRVLTVVPQILLSGSHSALHQPVRLVLQDRDALAKFLREHSPDRPTAVARVDFERKFVVAEWLGDQPSAGYSVEVAGAGINQAGWYCIDFSRYVPGPGCLAATVVTQPFVLVALDRHPEEFLFQDFIQEGDCPPVSPMGVARD
jgi:hypothetical protein